MMYQVWYSYYGEFLALGIWGILLALVRRVLFGKLCKEAALGNGGKGKMLKAMTLKFEKSYELNVGVYDRAAFVGKYLCQEKKFGIPLGQWRRLPERWTVLTLCIGFVETAVLWELGYDRSFYQNRLLAAFTAAAVICIAFLWLESDSLWEQARVYLLDYVANTLYPRQIHVYEGFQEGEKEKEMPKPAAGEGATPDSPPGLVLEKEEEQIFQEVLSDFLGSST